MKLLDQATSKNKPQQTIAANLATRFKTQMKLRKKAVMSPLTIASPTHKSGRSGLTLTSPIPANNFFRAPVAKKEIKGTIRKLKSPQTERKPQPNTANLPFDNLYGN